jgi:hypothetical protein
MFIAIQRDNGTFGEQEFSSMTEMIDFHLSEADSCHFEIIRDKQNLYFDFDLKASEGNVNIDSIREKISSYILTKTDKFSILIYGSCDTQKQSFHFVVRGIHFEDHNECGRTAKEIASAIVGFDPVVYTKRRNFRMLYSRKQHTTRVKQFITVFNHDYYTEMELIRMDVDRKFCLRESLITYIDDKRSLQQETIIIPKEFPISDRQTINWNSDLVSKAMQLVNELYPNTFKPGQQYGSLYRMNRVRSEKCFICNRDHDNADIMVGFYPEFNTFKYFCWQDNDRVMYYLSPPVNDDDQEVTLPVLKREQYDELQERIDSITERLLRSCQFYYPR